MKVTKPLIINYFKLIFRTTLFIFAFIFYLLYKTNNYNILESSAYPYVIWTIWGIFILEMFTRFIPSNFIEQGCQKHFAENYIPKESDEIKLQSWKKTFGVLCFWILLNGLLGILYLFNIIDRGILILVTLFYGVGDIVCILFFCPYRFFMKNRCCMDCRIYNWDYIWFFTLLIFIPSFYTYSLVSVALVILIHWEVMYRVHPERFSAMTNDYISCKNCKEKMCIHRKKFELTVKKILNSIKVKK